MGNLLARQQRTETIVLLTELGVLDQRNIEADPKLDRVAPIGPFVHNPYPAGFALRSQADTWRRAYCRRPALGDTPKLRSRNAKGPAPPGDTADKGYSSYGSKGLRVGAAMLVGFVLAAGKAAEPILPL